MAGQTVVLYKLAADVFDPHVVACSLLMPGKFAAVLLIDLTLLAVVAVLMRFNLERRRFASSAGQATVGWVDEGQAAEDQAVSKRSSFSTRLFKGVAVAGLVFQIIHLVEHLLQFGYWLAIGRATAWLSSWAAETAHSLDELARHIVPNAHASLGVELLHLTGNTIFLGALAAWQIVAKRAAQPPLRELHRAELVQSLHVAEHVLLVATLLASGNAIGLSTGFGLLSGTTLVASRVWFHFLINGVATWYATAAARKHSDLLNLNRFVARPAQVLRRA